MTGPDLRTRRLALGLSMEKLAQRLGVPKMTVARWEWGKLRIEHDTMLDLALRALEQKRDVSR